MPKLSHCAALALLIAAPLALPARADQGQAWTAPERASKRANPVSPSPAALAKGKAVYLKSCESCHGQSGDGDGPKAKDLSKKPASLVPAIKGQSDGALFWKVTEGKKPMPSFETDLTPDQIWQVIDYIRTLQGHK
ncbi:MAG TPA: cytochrome c [Holophagaceae bacterium]|nr:cytochrome c [Holophagaceae bacterium]